MLLIINSMLPREIYDFEAWSEQQISSIVKIFSSAVINLNAHVATAFSAVSALHGDLYAF